ncbi:MAG: family 16 glycosylhydrolase [Bacteroidia bacterium]
MRVLPIILLSAFVFFSCKNDGSKKEAAEGAEEETTIEVVKEKQSQSVLIKASEYLASDVSEKQVMSGTDVVTLINTNEPQWFEYDVDVPAAGRYRVTVKGAVVENNPIVWIEDYVDNKDDRTYNITSHIKLEGADVAPFSKEGVPLNKGVHKMRLHVEQGKANIESFEFELMKALVKTPKNMTQNMSGDDWDLVWSDEFNEGTSVDTTKWTYDFGDWGWGNRELQYYTKGENATIEDGNLVIEARKQDDGSWTSTRLTTREKTSFTYGRIEFRAKVPVEKGNWSAGWTLGDSYIDELSWPYCGEIDIMESVGYEINDETGAGKAHASIHVPAYYFKLGNQPTSIIDVANMKDEYHTYRIDWSREKIIAYVDDEPYFEFSDTSSSNTWPFNEPQDIILNLAMGGGWGGLQGMDTTVTSQMLYVDYVRVYGKKETEE